MNGTKRREKSKHPANRLDFRPLGLLLIALSVTNSAALAQERWLAMSYDLVGQWTAADGLPAETIAGMAVDENRQLWLGTYDGAVRYQGFDFRVINRNTTPALPNNRLMAMQAMAGGGVIVQFEDGRLGHLTEQTYEPIGQARRDHFVVFDQAVWLIDMNSERLQSWRPETGIADRGVTSVTALAVDHYADRLLLGTSDGLVLNWVRGSQRAAQIVRIGDDPLRGLAACPKGRLLAVDSSGAVEIDPSDNKTRLRTWQQQQERALRTAWTERGWVIANLWTQRGAGPHQLSPEGLEALDVIGTTGIDADHSPVTLEMIDHLGRRWINDGKNLYRDGSLMFRSSERILSFTVDTFDQIWISKFRQGLRLLKPAIIDTYGERAEDLAEPNITLVSEVDGRILVGSWVALSAFDPSTGDWQQLTQRAARDVLPDGEGLLVGSIGLCRLEEPMQCLYVEDFPGGDMQVQLLHRDATDAVWAGGEAGLFWRSPDGDWHQERLHPAPVRTGLELPDGRMIFGTNGDGLLWRQANAGLSAPFSQIGKDDGLSSAFIRSLLAVDGGVLVGTEDAGICLLDLSLEVTACMDTSDGLPHHSVHYMAVDPKERMWVNTNGGIYQVQLSGLLAYLRGDSGHPPGFARFGVRDGMPSVEGNGGVYRAGAVTEDGRIWFPNQFGLVAIRTDADVVPPGVALTPTITALTAKDDDNRLHLPSNARQLDVELAAIALAEPQNVQFRYRLGPTSNWMTLTNQRRIAFGDLPPGKHQLEVQARYLDTEWNGPTSRLRFSAGYRLHEHPIFHALISVVVIVILFNVWLAMRRRQARLQRRVEERTFQLDHATEQLEQLHSSLNKVDLRHRAALQAISHEFKGALDGALSPLLSQSAEALPKDKLNEVHQKTASLNRLIALVTDFSQHEPGAEPEEQAATSAVSEPHTPASVQAEAEPDSEAGASLNDKVRLQILLHLSDPDFSIDKLAANLGLSRSVLYRRVAEFSGTSPAELMRDLRLEQACRMLIESDEQISAIADATGFRSVSSFSRAFTKKIGTSPRRWREEHQLAATTGNG